MKSKRTIPLGSLIFYFLVIILIIIAFRRFSEIERVTRLFREARPAMLALAIGAQILTYLATAYIYYELLDIYKQKKAVKKGELFRASVVSLFLTQAVPTAGVSGNTFIIYFLNNKRVPMKQSVSIITLELFTYYAAHILLLFFVFLYFVFFLNWAVNGLLLAIGLVGAGLFLLISVLIVFFGSKRFLFFLRKARKFRSVSWILNKIKMGPLFRGSSEAGWESPLEILKNKREFLFWPLVWQIAILLLDAVTILFLFIGFNFHVPFSYIVLVLLLTKIISLVSVLPGALVFFEGSMVLFFSFFSVPLDLAVIITLLFRALSFWLPMPFGLYFYRRTHLEMK